jgi:hypothetical protein
MLNNTESPGDCPKDFNPKSSVDIVFFIYLNKPQSIASF